MHYFSVTAQQMSSNIFWDICSETKVFYDGGSLTGNEFKLINVSVVVIRLLAATACHSNAKIPPAEPCQFYNHANHNQHIGQLWIKRRSLTTLTAAIARMLKR